MRRKRVGSTIIRCRAEELLISDYPIHWFRVSLDDVLVAPCSRYFLYLHTSFELSDLTCLNRSLYKEIRHYIYKYIYIYIYISSFEKWRLKSGLSKNLTDLLSIPRNQTTVITSEIYIYIMPYGIRISISQCFCDTAFDDIVQHILNDSPWIIFFFFFTFSEFPGYWRDCSQAWIIVA